MSEEIWRFSDDLGPEKIIHLYNPSTALRAILVVDNVACGPSIGGARMEPDVSLEECFRLARAMTLKNAAAELPHGGGKSVIFADPRMDASSKERLMRSFARAIADVRDYIVGPDMGTDETCMAWCRDEIGRAVGLPAEIGGIPLDELGATGFGLAVCGEVAQGFCDVELAGARVVVQGFGSVGRHAARFLAERGAKVVAAADSRGAVAAPGGLDVDALIAHKLGGASVTEFAGGHAIAGDALLDVECEVFVPAARPDVIRADNVDRLTARLVLSGANIPVTAEAERILHERGVLVVPDFIANAGGVICAAVEYQRGTRRQAFDAIEEKIRRNTAVVLEEAAASGESPRDAAIAMATRRVRRAMRLRR
ncbi:MAG: Glu/Leu/Phe/Val dehydrogenase [Gammaproteobacteria bacterium]|nr:Glu/Leu/Phe/Val dehydrogenase [Gammaproteobacteria bacterium]